MGFSPKILSNSGPTAPQSRFGCKFQLPEVLSYAYAYSCYPNSGGNIPIRMPYVKYEGKSTVSNTRWPGNRIKRALLREFFIPTVWSLASMDASSALHTTGLRPDKSTRGSGRSSASSRGFESGDSNLSKLTDVFVTMQLTGPDVSLRLVMLIPLATKLCVFEAWNELTRID
jgi:hypothetical protein